MNDPPDPALIKSALADLTTTVSAKPPPKSSAISRAKIDQHDSPKDSPKPVDLGEIAKRVVAQLSEGTEPERRDLRHAAFCIWETKPALAENELALGRYLQLLKKLDRRSDFMRVAEAYVRCFDTKIPCIEKVARVLSDNADRLGEKWSQRAKELRLFDDSAGPLTVARISLSQDVDPVHFLRERDQWPDSLARAGFASAAWLEGVREIERSARDERDRFERLFLWNGPQSEGLLFPLLKHAFVNAMVSPYSKEGPKETGLRDAIVNFMLGILGDPRLEPHRWVGLDGASAIVNRWLVEQSFRQFLDIVEKISANEHQWDYRRAFWEGVYKKCQDKRIEVSAWVVFGTRGARAARESFGANVSFGVFRDNSQALRDTHAAFMIEIGEYLFVDWNESGPCNVWRKKTASRRPKLYENYYRRNDLTQSSPDGRSDDVLIPAGIFYHRGSANYVWQERIAKEIASAQGPRLWQADYRL